MHVGIPMRIEWPIEYRGIGMDTDEEKPSVTEDFKRVKAKFVKGRGPEATPVSIFYPLTIRNFMAFFC